jgi:hypothetical protein
MRKKTTIGGLLALAMVLALSASTAASESQDHDFYDTYTCDTYCVFERCARGDDEPFPYFRYIAPDLSVSSYACPYYTVAECDIKSDELCFVAGPYDTRSEAEERRAELRAACSEPERDEPDWWDGPKWGPDEPYFSPDPAPDSPERWIGTEPVGGF